jgi:hypothetical protein
MSVVESYRHEFALNQSGRAILAEEREAKLIEDLAMTRHSLRFWRFVAVMSGLGWLACGIVFLVAT